MPGVTGSESNWYGACQTLELLNVLMLGFVFFPVHCKSNAEYCNTSVYLEARHIIFWELWYHTWHCALFEGKNSSEAHCSKAHLSLKVCCHFTVQLQADSCAEIKVKQNKKPQSR